MKSLGELRAVAEEEPRPSWNDFRQITTLPEIVLLFFSGNLKPRDAPQNCHGLFSTSCFARHLGVNYADALPDPQLRLAEVDDSNSPTGTTIIGTNDNWKTIDDDSPTTLPVEQRVALEEELQAASYAPSNVLESILWPTLRPGAYTTVLSGSSNTTAVGIIELYEY